MGIETRIKYNPSKQQVVAESGVAPNTLPGMFFTTIPTVILSLVDDAGAAVAVPAGAQAEFCIDDDWAHATAPLAHATKAQITVDAAAGTFTFSLNLNTAGIESALATNRTLDVWAELRVFEETGLTPIMVAQFEVRLINVLDNDTAPEPAEGDPPYPDPSEIVTVNGSGKVKVPIPYVFVVETGLWYPLVVNIVDGQPQLGIGEGEAL
jgi:hypothetical protein